MGKLQYHYAVGHLAKYLFSYGNFSNITNILCQVLYITKIFCALFFVTNIFSTFCYDHHQIVGPVLYHQNQYSFHPKMVWSNDHEITIFSYFTRIGWTKGQTSHS